MPLYLAYCPDPPEMHRRMFTRYRDRMARDQYPIADIVVEEGWIVQAVDLETDDRYLPGIGTVKRLV